ncbi:hypothetical protein [Flexilinea flocculi]|uniref:Uncharacterized protein n=1 Tax=Flexilinea flocculi TaxID=1678840 RepID=A0A0S7BUG2_9CHLR|nr:hypothetical protein [Flexilinea flocculi]GAP40868.1 hypothetical protein ATC1_13850 [Flexilinea flocculi]
MDQLPTLQQLEYLESGFEVSKILAHAGFSMEKPAFSITLGQIAEEIAHTLSDHGLPPDRLEEDFLIDLAQRIQKVLQNDDVLFWRNSARAYTTDQPTLMAFMSSPNEEDDEGSLTEQYENAIRLGDDGAYWPDGGASADLFDEF